MNEICIGELYQELVIGLNGLIEKTVEIQKTTNCNTNDYREALRFQIELEQTKLNIMETLEEGFHHKITKKELVGADELGRNILEIKNVGDARFVAPLDKQSDKAMKFLRKEVVVNVGVSSVVGDELEVLMDGKCVGKLKVNLNKCTNENASQFATEIMYAIKTKKGGKY